MGLPILWQGLSLSVDLPYLLKGLSLFVDLPNTGWWVLCFFCRFDSDWKFDHLYFKLQFWRNIARYRLWWIPMFWPKFEREMGVKWLGKEREDKGECGKGKWGSVTIRTLDWSEVIKQQQSIYDKFCSITYGVFHFVVRVNNFVDLVGTSGFNMCRSSTVNYLCIETFKCIIIPFQRYQKTSVHDWICIQLQFHIQLWSCIMSWYRVFLYHYIYTPCFLVFLSVFCSSGLVQWNIVAMSFRLGLFFSFSTVWIFLWVLRCDANVDKLVV